MEEGVWCREHKCSTCPCSFFEPIRLGHPPRRCPSCRDEPKPGRELIAEDLQEVRRRALVERHEISRSSLVRAVHRAGSARGIPAQREALLDLSATALALATRTPGHRFKGREAA